MKQLLFLALAICLCGAMTGAAPAPSFSFRVRDGRPVANSADGKTVAPLSADALSIERGAGISGDALRADGPYVAYPATVIPPDRGTVEAWVSPLDKGTEIGFFFFVGSADEWGPEGCPRLWYYVGYPRFDMDPGPRLVSARMKVPELWTPGLWSHYAATYDRKLGEVAIYVNGELLQRKGVTPWQAPRCRTLTIGSSRSWNSPGFSPGYALIDSVNFYDRVLTPEEIREVRNRVSLPQLHFEGAGSEVLTRPGEKVVFNARNIGNAPWEGRLSWCFADGSGRENATLRLAPGEVRQITVAAPPRADAKGNVVLRITGARQGEKRKPVTFPLAFFDASRAGQAATVDDVPAWRPVACIDASASEPAAAVGTHRAVVTPAGLRYRECGSPKDDRFAYTFKLSGKDRLLRLRVTVPDDRKRTVMIAQTLPRWQFEGALGMEQQVLGSGALTGDLSPVSGKMLELEYLFFCPEDEVGIIISNFIDNAPAAIGKLELDEAVSPDARIAPKAAKAKIPAPGAARRSGLYWEDPVMTQCFGWAGRDYVPFDRYVSRAMDYCDYTGADEIVYPVVWYNGPVYRSSCERGTYPNGMRFHPAQYPRLLAKRCADRGIRFVGVFNLHRLPSLAGRIGTEEDLIAGKDYLNCVTRTGEVMVRHTFSSPPQLNLLRGEVQGALLALADEYLAMCADQKSFGGIGMALWQGVPLQLGMNLDTSYDDWTMREFARHIGEKLPGEPGAKLRFRQRSRWILRDPARRAKFIEWRMGIVSAFYEKLADRILKASPDARLRLQVMYPLPDKEGIDAAQSLREQGIDLERLSRHPGIVFERIVNQTNGRMEERWHKDLPFDRIELTGKFQKPFMNREHFGVIVHQQYFESHGIFARREPQLKLPAPWTREALGRCTAVVPVGDNFMRYFAKSLELFDATRLDIGGYTLGHHGVEDTVRRWTAIYRSLPDVRFADCGGRVSGVLLRGAKTGPFQYYYLVNTTSAPQTVSLSGLPADAVHTLDGAPVADGARLELRPWGLIVLRGTAGAAVNPARLQPEGK